MAMEATKRLLRSYQNAAINLRKVALEMEKREDITPEMVNTSRGRALIYETVANELAIALREDKVKLD
jgi:hypothetical protein